MERARLPLPVIRPLEPADHGDAAALIRLAFSALEVRPPPSALQVSAADVAAAGGGWAVAPLSAVLLWTIQADALHLHRLAVHPACRRTGLAAALLAHAEEFSRAQGHARLTVSTRLALAGNRELFDRAGYVETGRSAHPGFTDPTWVDLEKRLA